MFTLHEIIQFERMLILMNWKTEGIYLSDNRKIKNQFEDKRILDITDIYFMIEKSRDKLYLIIENEEYNNILEASQELDELIVKYMLQYKP